jgi:hypothetical protein
LRDCGYPKSIKKAKLTVFIDSGIIETEDRIGDL